VQSTPSVTSTVNLKPGALAPVYTNTTKIMSYKLAGAVEYETVRAVPAASVNVAAAPLELNDEVRQSPEEQ
jgi:hypothetical protein